MSKNNKTYYHVDYWKGENKQDFVKKASNKIAKPMPNLKIEKVNTILEDSKMLKESHYSGREYRIW